MLPIYLERTASGFDDALLGRSESPSSDEQKVHAPSIFKRMDPVDNDDCVVEPSFSSSKESKRHSCGGVRPRTQLGPDFIPSEYDVICARGKDAWNHLGNKNFRALIQEWTEAYSKTESKTQRTGIVSNIIQSVRSLGTGFVKREDDGEWIEVGDVHARDKVGQLLRNALSSKYRSSRSCKKQRRRRVHVKRANNLHGVLVSNNEIRSSMNSLKEDAHNQFLSDEEVTARFTQSQLNMINAMKADPSLVDHFLQAEVSSCLVMVDRDGDSTMSI